MPSKNSYFWIVSGGAVAGIALFGLYKYCHYRRRKLGNMNKVKKPQSTGAGVCSTSSSSSSDQPKAPPPPDATRQFAASLGFDLYLMKGWVLYPGKEEYPRSIGELVCEADVSRPQITVMLEDLQSCHFSFDAYVSMQKAELHETMQEVCPTITEQSCHEAEDFKVRQLEVIYDTDLDGRLQKCRVLNVIAHIQHRVIANVQLFCREESASVYLSYFHFMCFDIFGHLMEKMAESVLHIGWSCGFASDQQMKVSPSSFSSTAILSLPFSTRWEIVASSSSSCPSSSKTEKEPNTAVLSTSTPVSPSKSAVSIVQLLYYHTVSDAPNDPQHDGNNNEFTSSVQNKDQGDFRLEKLVRYYTYPNSSSFEKHESVLNQKASILSKELQVVRVGLSSSVSLETVTNSVHHPLADKCTPGFAVVQHIPSGFMIRFPFDSSKMKLRSRCFGNFTFELFPFGEVDHSNSKWSMLVAVHAVPSIETTHLYEEVIMQTCYHGFRLVAPPKPSRGAIIVEMKHMETMEQVRVQWLYHQHSAAQVCWIQNEEQGSTTPWQQRFFDQVQLSWDK